MSDLVTSIKALGAKMTGKDIAGKDLVQVVDNITENYEGGGGGGGATVIQLTGTILSNQTAQTELSLNIDDWDGLWSNIQSGQPVVAFYKYTSGQIENYRLASADIYQGRKRLYLQYNQRTLWHMFEIKGPQYPGGPTDINWYSGSYAAQSS